MALRRGRRRVGSSMVAMVAVFVEEGETGFFLEMGVGRDGHERNNRAGASGFAFSMVEKVCAIAQWRKWLVGL